MPRSAIAKAVEAWNLKRHCLPGNAQFEVPLVVRAGDGAWICATDGHHIVARQWPWEFECELPPESAPDTVLGAIADWLKEAPSPDEVVSIDLAALIEFAGPATFPTKCATCSGTSRVTCLTCQGDWKLGTPCEECSGKGTCVGGVCCDTCDGSGAADRSNADSPECPVCQGEAVVDGVVPCDVCDGVGRYECRACDGGQVPCEESDCHKGWIKLTAAPVAICGLPFDRHLVARALAAFSTTQDAAPATVQVYRATTLSGNLVLNAPGIKIGVMPMISSVLAEVEDTFLASEDLPQRGVQNSAPTPRRARTARRRA